MPISFRKLQNEVAQMKSVTEPKIYCVVSANVVVCLSNEERKWMEGGPTQTLIYGWKGPMQTLIYENGRFGLFYQAVC